MMAAEVGWTLGRRISVEMVRNLDQRGRRLVGRLRD